MYNKAKNIIILHNARFIARKLFRLLVVILLFYCFYIFSEKQDELNKLLTKTDNKLLNLYEIIKKNTCKNIVINGVKYSDYKNIQNHINKYCSDKYENTKDLKVSIKKDVWIKDVKVLVKLPNNIIIDIVEYSPFALITNDGTIYKLVDEFGNLININQSDIIMFGYLLKIVGSGIEDYEINNLFNMLSIHHKVAKNISSVIRVGNRRWDVVFLNNIIVKMPEENDNISEAWNIFNNITNITEILSDLKEIDIRNRDKVYLKYNNKTFKEITNL